MESGVLEPEEEIKQTIEPVKKICRCCLSTERRMLNTTMFEAYFRELTGLNVSQSDGLPQWLCWECSTLLQKSVRFKQKVLKAHKILYEYLTRCAPFPIDATDPELSKYATPHLCVTNTLSLRTNGRGKSGYKKPITHKKQIYEMELDVNDIPLNKDEDIVKEETGFSDYEDNVTLDEFRMTAPKITDNDIENVLEERMAVDVKEELPVTKKRKIKKKHAKVKKKSSDEDFQVDAKRSVRKTIEVDPTKIRIIKLNPEEQVKQREAESKASLKFPFQCNLCFKGFNFESKLQNHMTKHSPNRGPFECKLCHMYLPTTYSFSVHSLIHTTRYECVKCLRRMIDRASIVEHYRSQHEGLVTIHTCHICGKVSNNNKTHRGHLRNHHGGDRPKCELCGKSFINKDSLAEHQQIHKGIKHYECVICGMRFRTRTQIKHHQLRHTDVKEFYCVECDVRFKSAHNLRQHLTKSLKHKDKHSFKWGCSRCDKRFESEALATRHVRVQHEGERSHRCRDCGAALASKNSLQKHILTVHQGNRPPPKHVCDTCGKAFRGKSVLDNHARIHTGEKPYECAECGRKFTQRTAMKTHIKLVHLKIRRSAKIKPEVPPEVPEPKLDLFTKEETPLVFEAWNRQSIQPCDVFFHVTAGP